MALAAKGNNVDLNVEASPTTHPFGEQVVRVIGGAMPAKLAVLAAELVKQALVHDLHATAHSSAGT